MYLIGLFLFSIYRGSIGHVEENRAPVLHYSKVFKKEMWFFHTRFCSHSAVGPILPATQAATQALF